MELPKVLVDFSKVNSRGLVLSNIRDISEKPGGFVPIKGSKLKAADKEFRCVAEVEFVSATDTGDMVLSLHYDTWRTKQKPDQHQDYNNGFHKQNGRK